MHLDPHLIPAFSDIRTFITNRGIRFLRHLIKEHPPINKKYSKIVEMAATQVILPAASPNPEIRESAKNDSTDGKKRAIEDVEEEIKAFEARFEAMQRQRMEWEARLKNGGSTPMMDDSVMEVEGSNKVGRWIKWSGEWVPRPIGVL